LRGDEVFAAARTIGLLLAVGLTGLMVLLATLFNLVSDMVGGVRVSVLEDETRGGMSYVAGEIHTTETLVQTVLVPKGSTGQTPQNWCQQTLVRQICPGKPGFSII